MEEWNGNPETEWFLMFEEITLKPLTISVNVLRYGTTLNCDDFNLITTKLSWCEIDLVLNE